ncbi:hypothetical protein [Cryobacterium tagatosivorans]|uniref:Polynucleotide kinase PNKP phosphatase domain-containing protein n=1 Tax=Cryobacterium tagatosivorans TaxID=1259199 RepID=A0A4R8UAA2_9MICO|nr:hypothetical protein [Cryobacterium tagatosivorans]TFB46952.1 hypothetical protein E3O23_15880 [Cryobacterium tagatosivorans]
MNELSGGPVQIALAKPRMVVCDVDGTLCDVRTIRHHVDPLLEGFSGKRDFGRFHSQSIDCPANAWVVELVRLLSVEGWAIGIVTAREERWSFLTTLWLAEHGVPYDQIHFRRNRDNRSGVLVKSDILASLSRTNAIGLAIDDNPGVVGLWQSSAIPTVVVSADGTPAKLGLCHHFAPGQEFPDVREFVRRFQMP